MAAVLGNWEFTRNIGADLATLVPYFIKGNYLLPISETLVALGLFLSLQILLATFYWINRIINLIRGAG